MKKNSSGLYRHTFMFNGKRYDIRAKKERDLWTKVAQKKHDLENGICVSNEHTTVDKWMERYLTTYKLGHVSDKTYADLQSLNHNYISSAIGTLRLKEVKPIDLQRIVNDRAGCSASHIHKLQDLIKASFSAAYRNGLLARNPSDGLTIPDATNGTHRAITYDERRHIMHVAETHRAGPWVLTLLGCGLRPIEADNLLWGDVDILRRMLWVRSAKTDYGTRAVPMPNYLARRLITLYRAAKPNSDSHVFTQPSTGRPHTHASRRQMWRSFSRAVNIDMGAQTDGRGHLITSVIADDLTPYCLRHTFCTDLQRAGVPINVAKDLMGHKSIAVTARIYTHITDDVLADAASRIRSFDRAKATGRVVALDRRA